MDLLDLYDRGSAWTATRVAGAADQLEAQTPCERWTVRDVVNHLLEGADFFVDRAEGKDHPGPSEMPPDLLGDRDAAAAHAEARQRTLDAYSQPGVVEKTGRLLGIAFADHLVHGWDLARATGQDAAIPDDLAEAALGMVGGNLTPERRGTGFKPEITVPDGAAIQQKLLAYLGREPG